MNAGPPRWRLAAFAAPQIPLAALYTPVFVFLAAFYVDERGLDPAALAVVFVSARIVDAITDPLIGLLSDRTPPRWGRRKLWLLLATPLVCLSVWMAFVPPQDATIGYVALWLTALTLSWTLALTPYFAWGAELSDDYAGRARATAWRESAFLIGTLLASILYAVAPAAAAADAKTAGDGMRSIAIFVVIALPPAALLAAWLAPEPGDRSAAGTRGGFSIADLGAGLRGMAANAPFRRLIASYFVNSASNALPAALFPFYCALVLEAEQEEIGLLFVAYLLCAVAGAPIWSWAAARFGKHRAWGAAMIFACAVFAVAPFLGPGDVWIFFVICVLTGVAYGAEVILPSAMQADVVDVDTADNGAQRTGLYFAAWSVAFKVAGGFAVGAALAALSVVGFDAEAETQTPAALTALAIAYAAAPIVLKLIAVAMIWRFPLDAAAQAALRQRIEAARAAESA